MKKLLTYGIAAVLIVGFTPVIQAQNVAPAGTMATPGGGQMEHPGNEHHPEIHKAIHVLEKAKDDLEHAAHDYAGHRTKAIEHIDAALEELHAALQVDEK